MSGGGFYYSREHDVNDGKQWSEMDVADLMASLEAGNTLEEAAGFLCRSGTVEDVRAKADELGLVYNRGKMGLRPRPRRLGGGKTKNKPAKQKGAMHRWRGRLVPDKVK